MQVTVKLTEDFKEVVRPRGVDCFRWIGVLDGKVIELWAAERGPIDSRDIRRYVIEDIKDCPKYRYVMQQQISVSEACAQVGTELTVRFTGEFQTVSCPPGGLLCRWCLGFTAGGIPFKFLMVEPFQVEGESPNGEEISSDSSQSSEAPFFTG